MKWTLDQVSTHSPNEVNYRLSKYSLSTEEKPFTLITHSVKFTGIYKTQTSHVNKLSVLLFYIPKYIPVHILHSCTHFTFMYTFFIHVLNKNTLVDSMWGHIKVPGESVTVCAWSPHFPLCDEGAIRAFTLVFCSEWVPLLKWPGICTDVPTKSGHDFIRALYGDVSMTWGFQMTTFTSHLCQGWGVSKKNA